MREDFREYLVDIDLSKRILEIGPFNDPLLTKEESNVFYADIRSTEEVDAKYSAACKGTKKLVPIDYIVRTTYRETFEDSEKFDYVLASHVLEHIPRLIEFFLDVSSILSPNGDLYLFIPDHRYCFDHFRAPTSFAEAYYVHSQNLPCAPWRVLDSVVDCTSLNDPVAFAQKKGVYAATFLAKPNLEDVIKHYGGCPEQLHPGTHFSVFSPYSFLVLISNLLLASLFPYRLESFFPTPKNTFTFGLILRNCPEMPGDSKATRRELIKIAKLMDSGVVD